MGELTEEKRTLKKCPFCGSEADKIINFGRNGVGCTNCDANMRSPEIASDSFENLIEAWNNRPVEDELVELLRDLALSFEAFNSAPEDDIKEHCYIILEESLIRAKEALRKVGE